MTAFKKILAGSVAIAALASAAPAAAQYPGYGYGSGSGAGIIGQVINSVIGGGYGSGSGYGSGYGSSYGYNGYNNSYGQNPYSRYGAMGQNAITQCMGAVQQRLSASYPYANGYQNNGYQNNGYQNGYGYQQQQQYSGYNGARVLGISDIDQRSNGGLSIRGVANSGRNAAYGNGGGYGGYGGGGYGGGYGNGYNPSPVDLTFRCKTDASGYIVDIDIEQATSGYGYNNSRAYTPYNYDYSQYGYRRY